MTYPNVDPPLSIIALAPWLWVGQVLRVAHTYNAQVTLVSLPFVVLIPLLGAIVVAALRVTAPTAPPTTRLLAFALIGLGPLTWICVASACRPTDRKSGPCSRSRRWGYRYSRR